MAITEQQLHEVVASRRSVDDLIVYFRGVGTTRPLDGARFNSFDGGGDTADANRITAGDVLAVGLLSVKIPGAAVLELVEGRLGHEVGELLAQVDVTTELGTDAAAEALAAEMPASRAWTRLTQQHGLEWVTASKLLARKRPHLIPVNDRVVRCVLGKPTGPWLWLNELLRYQGPLRSQLVELRDAAGLSPEVPVPRVLDVILWMRHHDGHAYSGVCGRAGLPTV